MPWALIPRSDGPAPPRCPQTRRADTAGGEAHEQNASKERAISSLRMDMQRLVRGWERACWWGDLR